MRRIHHQPIHDFATVLMLAAVVVGAMAQLVGAVIKIGQVAGWWH